MIEDICEYNDENYKGVDSIRCLVESNNWSYASHCIRYFDIEHINYLTVPQLMIRNHENIPLIVVFWIAKQWRHAIKMLEVAGIHGDMYGHHLKVLLFEHPLFKELPDDWLEY